MFLQQDYTHQHKQKNIVCDFIVGAKGMCSNDSKETMYKKQQNNDIIKKYLIYYIFQKTLHLHSENTLSKLNYDF